MCDSIHMGMTVVYNTDTSCVIVVYTIVYDIHTGRYV